MNTPGAPEQGAISPLYGVGCHSINLGSGYRRRWRVGGPCSLLPAAAAAPKSAADSRVAEFDGRDGWIRGVRSPRGHACYRSHESGTAVKATRIGCGPPAARGRPSLPSLTGATLPKKGEPPLTEQTQRSGGPVDPYQARLAFNAADLQLRSAAGDRAAERCRRAQLHRESTARPAGRRSGSQSAGRARRYRRRGDTAAAAGQTRRAS